MMKLRGSRSVIAALEGLKQKYTTNDTWVVESGARYSLYVEVGTSTHAAQPYFRPGIQAVKPRAGKIIREHGLERGLEVIAKEIEKEIQKRAPVDTGHLKANVKAYKI